MRYGFFRVAAATPKIKVGNPSFNAKNIMELIDRACEKGAKAIVFPQLALTGATCGDLFNNVTLIEKTMKELKEILEFSKGKEIFVALGMPLFKDNKSFNVAAIFENGKLLAFVPKTNINNRSANHEGRLFSTPSEFDDYYDFFGEKVPFGTKILFRNKELDKLVIGIELGEDIDMMLPPSCLHAAKGANLILNLGASFDIVGAKESLEKTLVAQSKKTNAGYAFANAGEGESTTDFVYSGNKWIIDCGKVLVDSKKSSTIKTEAGDFCFAEIDLERINQKRVREFSSKKNQGIEQIIKDYQTVEFSYPSLADELPTYELTNPPRKLVFVPENENECELRCKEIIRMQVLGLKKRISHIGIKNTVIGVSGGLDSTLTMLVLKETYEELGLDKQGIHAITMPCFGTTNRTYNNALLLAKECGATILEIPIKESVIQHFKDINHDINSLDVTYENAQARERTQVLMDLANKINGLVVGTGDMSELALGWATYNGDHMSMYGTNANLPKTLIRFIVKYYAKNTDSAKLKRVLFDILDTPVSPELLPPTDNEISQKTEEIVGPYDLHDYFLYYLVGYGFSKEKILHLAKASFKGVYSNETIEKWLNTFIRRFFTQQFKRSCLPDGPKVGRIGLSPRGDLMMPSDASYTDFLE